MKNFVRAFALALVATGAAASFHLTAAAQPVEPTRLSAYPVPTCPPDDPDACGIDKVMHPKAQ